ncbi:MAG: bifunctional hydroxymethylpyrimidine kinase/phosphomethylpyrimidine kinase [Lachnospiraceae bacterium]|nr:bifunctional hydroxymethylpyrimidine kinase/phosphomethylpyrimidine kinase [Lachnospiraceae bacterium]
MKTALSIAGSDSSGGAGIQADIKTMLMNGVYAMSAITALTAQNTTGVRAVLEVSTEFLRQQLDAVFEDIFPDAVKIGMVPSAPLAKRVAQRLRHYGARKIVIDPVMAASSGSVLMKTEAVEALMKELLPMAKLVTPNIPEGEVLSGMAIRNREDMVAAAEKIGETYGCAVLLKGGHGTGGADDVLYRNGMCRWFYGVRIDNPNTHGTGCTLSSAIAANLAKGLLLEEAVACAREYVSGAIGAMLNIGKGSGPLDHGFMINTEKTDDSCN